MKKIINFDGIKIAIVDAYSTGNCLSKRFQSLGARVIHVQSKHVIPDLLRTSFIEEDFEENLIFDGNFESFVFQIKAYQPDYVISGSEIGVEFADYLCHELKLNYSNDYSLTLARRDKYLMLEAIRDKGIPAAEQIKSGSIAALTDWAHSRRLWPIVVKPLNSSSSDGFSICHTIQEFRLSCQKILKKTNILGFINEEILAQELLVGTQYVVNTVSESGHHYVTDVWEMKVRHTKEIPMIIDSMTLIEGTSQKYTELTDYMFDVLDALGVRNGAAHSEVMYTEFGPSLIEVNSRLMGGNIDSTFKDALSGYDQIDAYVDSILNPDKLSSILGGGCKLGTYLSEVDFVFYKSGKLTYFDREVDIRNLKSFKSFTKTQQIGTQVNMTADTTNQAGLLYLMNDDFEQLTADRDKVIEWQVNDEIFTIE